MSNNIYLILMSISLLICLIVFYYILKRKDNNQMSKIFVIIFILQTIHLSALIAQILCSKTKIPPIFFENFAYISGCFLPLAFLFAGIVFSKTKIKLARIHLLLFIIPIISLLILWTNDFHHLFYAKYSINLDETIFGPYMSIHSIYSYVLLFIGLLYLLKYSIKNAGFFSRQSVLILIGTSIPLILNILGAIGIIKTSVYVTPIAFTVATLFYALAIFKFKFLSITPIALQKIFDRISDGYIVIDENNKITDFNETFLKMSKFKEALVRNKNIFELIKSTSINIDTEELNKILISVKGTTKTLTLDKHFESLKKHFHIEFSSLNNKDSFIGTLILFKDITQHIEDMDTIKRTQDTLMESERLSSLGQLIGGIAHNLKTPIMSISGAAEGLTDLIKEYDLSIGDSEVTAQDHHDIANDMSTWVSKIKNYTEYMSDIITAVKGQAVTLSETENVSFDLEELVKRVDILMKHELKNAIIYLNVSMQADSNIIINGDVNSLVQVINNMISNSIQAYNGKPEQKIDLILKKTEDNNLIITIKDYGPGLPEKVKSKLFKEMITTKGKNGTGLGLYMSYSTIKAHFNGDISVESEEGKGTTFNITLPL